MQHSTAGILMGLPWRAHVQVTVQMVH